MQLPKLSAIPALITQPLLIKATSSGITFLKENSFHSRYTGNKFSIVDPNGNLWLKKSEFDKEQKKQGVAPKKLARVKTQAADNFTIDAAQISQNLCTPINSLQTNFTKLSTNLVKTYQINKKEVRQRILSYINTQKGRKELYFFTVTFPQGTGDAVAYRIFNIWLTRLRFYGLLKEYIWIAERQEINPPLVQGTIHFHIAIPHKLYAPKANAMMRGTLKTFAKRGEIPFSLWQCRRYNGVDISKNRKTGRVTNFAIKKGRASLVGYLTKYITKNNATFEHLAWHNSRGYSSIFTGVTMSVAEFHKNGVGQWLDMRRSKKGETDFFIFIPWISDPPPWITEHLYGLNSGLQFLLDELLISKMSGSLIYEPVFCN